MPSVSSGHEPRAGGDDQDVVGKHAAVAQVHLVGGGVDAVDLGLREHDVAVQLAAPRPDEVLGVGEAERHEQQPRLVDVGVVAIDDGDLGLVGRARRGAGGSP